MWTLIGRVAMNIFQREDSEFFFMKVFVKLTNPLIRINSAFRPPKHKNLPSIPPSQLGDFLGILSKANLRATTRYLILWQLHTITRPVEAAETKWADINFEKHIWTIPAARMKRRRDHSIPLSTSCMNILNSMKPLSRHKEYVFTSERNPNKPTNSQTANMAIKPDCCCSLHRPPPAAWYS